MGTVTGDDLPAKCFQTDQLGNPAICTSDGQGGWIVSFDDGPGVGGDPELPGPPVGFILVFVLVLLGGVAITIWKVTTARRMARSSGMSTGDATAMTLLTDDGLEATYLASNLRTPQQAPAPAPGAPAASRGTTAERLAELQSLRGQGLVTDEEYATARQKILGDL